MTTTETTATVPATTKPIAPFLMRVKNVQAQIDVPKGQRNNFGNYSYRSAEDILEAAKPLLDENDLVFTISDAIVVEEGRYYVEATGTLYDAWDDSNAISVTGYARESEKKTGMDDSQLTGATSSYARKYMMNGLFNIDDAKDADTEAYSVESKARAKTSAPAASANTGDGKATLTGRKATEKQRDFAMKLLEKNSMTLADYDAKPLDGDGNIDSGVAKAIIEELKAPASGTASKSSGNRW